MNKTKKPTLLVMAAGMGSRYGGIKQMDSFGPNGETIMDYSLFDALREGFGKVVFVVREEIRPDIEALFFPKLSGKATAHCVVQSINRFVPPQYVPVTRQKPWGTAHAVLCGRDVINEPFAVINADDFYGRTAFRSLARFLTTSQDHAMVGYRLGNVLSDHGSVSRGIVTTKEDGTLKNIVETTGIVREHGKISAATGSAKKALNAHVKVSMNCWGFMPNIFDVMADMFTDFVTQHHSKPDAELYIGLPVTHIIEKHLGQVHVIPGGNTWFGVTYKEDRANVCRHIDTLIHDGAYPADLW